MGNHSFVWRSFWDVASPKQAAQTLVEFYGAAAASTATHCALAAERDGRDADRRFWQAALEELRSGHNKTADANGPQSSSQGNGRRQTS